MLNRTISIILPIIFVYIYAYTRRLILKKTRFREINIKVNESQFRQGGGNLELFQRAKSAEKHIEKG